MHCYGNLHYGHGLKDLFGQGRVVGMPRIEHVDEVCGVGKQHITKFPSQRWCLSDTFRFHRFITKGITSWIKVFCGIHG